MDKNSPSTLRVTQCFILPLNHHVGVGMGARVQPDRLLVELGWVDGPLLIFGRRQ